MDGFLGQFLAQAWPLVVFIVAMIALYIGLLVWTGQRRKAAQQAKKASIQQELEDKPRAAKQRKQEKKTVKAVAEPESFSSILDEYDDPLEANRMDELLAEPVVDDYDEFMTGDISDDSPLADLYQARETAEKERTLQEDEEIVALASLLAGLGDEEDDETVYHTVSENPLAVKLADGISTYAKEHISILRDERDERLIVQLGDTGFRTLLDDKEAKSTFTRVMKELSGIILKADESSDLEETAADADSYHEVLSEPVHIKLHGGGETTALELMSIMRDERDARLMIQMGDIAYRSLANEKRDKLIFTKTMKELAAVILTVDDNPPKVEPQAKPQISRPVPEQVTNNIKNTQEEESEEDIPGVINIPKMDDLPPTHSVGRFGRIDIKKPVEPVPELNIAEAIEKYLQYKIEHNPQFQNRNIHIQQAFGGVRIMVGNQFYDFVDEIEDAEARAFIQETINEWQEQH